MNQSIAKEDNDPEMASFISLFRFATTFDLALIVIGTVFAIAMGAAEAIFAILWGNMTSNFEDTGKIEE